MLIALYVIIAVLVAVIICGLLLVRNQVQFGNARIRIPKIDLDLDAPVGACLVLAAILGIVYCYTQLKTTLTAENERLTQELDASRANEGKTRTELEAALKAGDVTRQTAQKDVDSARQQVAELTASNRELVASSARETAARRDAERAVHAALSSIDVDGLSEAERKEYDVIAGGIAAINSQLPDLQVAATPWPKIAGTKILARYEIYRKAFRQDAAQARGAGLFDFDRQKFMLQGDYKGQLREVIRDQLLRSICRTAQRAVVEGVSLPQLTQEMMQQIPRIPGFDVPQQLISELNQLTYAQMRLKMLAGHTLVLVRGYADGERGPWREDLGASTRSLSVHANVETDPSRSEYLMTFQPTISAVQLGRVDQSGVTYGNADLPDLRAGEVASVLTLLIDGCPIPGRNSTDGTTKVEILDGTIYPQHSPADRKTRVYVVAYSRNE